MAWIRLKLWVRLSSRVPSTQLFRQARGRIRSSCRCQGSLTQNSTAISSRLTTAMQARYTRGRKAGPRPKAAAWPPTYQASGASRNWVMHWRMPNRTLLVRSSPTSCTSRDTPSARVKTAFWARMAMKA